MRERVEKKAIELVEGFLVFEFDLVGGALDYDNLVILKADLY
jgi:hypothetical protein